MKYKDKVNAKPSDSIGNEDILRAKAEEANRKRQQRKCKRQMEDAMNPEPEVKPEPEVRPEPEVKPEPEPEVKPEPDRAFGLGKKIKVRVNGVDYDSINAALRGTGNQLWANETDYRRSCWTKINRELKKNGKSTHSGFDFELV